MIGAQGIDGNDEQIAGRCAGRKTWRYTQQKYEERTAKGHEDATIISHRNCCIGAASSPLC
jgi:hypothetical protein